MPEPIIWILEDQLFTELSLLKKYPTAPVLMVESNFAFRLFRYHKKRLTFLISAMRHFRDELIAAGRTVYYYPLKPESYLDSLSALRDCSRKSGSRKFVVVRPSEYHTTVWLEGLRDYEIEFEPNDLFLTNRDEFSTWARRQKSPVMETFYRGMRRRHRVLMDGTKPAGGAWNFDKLNRKSPPGTLLIPPPPKTEPDELTRTVMAEVERRFADHPGSTEGFDYPVTATAATAALTEFLTKRLPAFGDYEDAMLTGQPLLYHSRISSALNAGLLSPMQCVRGAEAEYHAGRAPLNAVEGFVRQILGWREYMYGIYWTYMPEYRDRNARGDTLPLPNYFWTGTTDLNCLRQTLSNVVEQAYSHHIQRLMVICNFATLVGFSPRAVNDWFLEMYIDSHDWVVTPNVIGMAMNADGGTCATKPYVSSGAYIDRMSNYCSGCKFNPKVRTGPTACPFNYLYWTFLEKNRQTVAKNSRIGMVVKYLDKMDPDELEQMRVARRKLVESFDSSY